MLSSSSLFGHHALVPYGIEREDDIDALHALDFGDLLIDVFDQHIRHWTVGGGERHADVRHTVRFVVYFVDQPQVVDIDRDFGIVDILERGDDIFFYL